MKARDIKSFFLSYNSTYRQAINCIDKNACGIALVVDAEARLIGTITDGDIRRALLEGNGLDLPIATILDKKKSSMYPEPITAAQGTPRDLLLALMKKYSIRQIPLLDVENRVVELVTVNDLLPEEALAVQAVLMAGGQGNRLRPLTEDLPKPMLPVGGRPLMEIVLTQLSEAGISRVIVTTHYLSEKIKEYFGNGRTWGVDINYVSEDRPLGTAGSVGLIDKPNEPLLVMNGDILTKLDFRAMLSFHKKHKADMTVAVRPYEFQVPYGIIKSDGPVIKEILEKPTYHFLVNAGIYLLEPHVQAYIPTQEKFDMTDLMVRLIQDGRTIVSFPILEYWLDIGQHSDYEQAQKDFNEGKIKP